MKVYLLYREKDFPWQNENAKFDQEMIRDLELELIYQEMAGGNDLIYRVVKEVSMEMLQEEQQILYRQKILQDCIENPQIIEQLEELIERAFTKEKENNHFGVFSDYPVAVIGQASAIIRAYMEELKTLRKIAGEKKKNFFSEGFLNLFQRIEQELDDEFFREVEVHLAKCEFKGGIQMNVSLDLNHGLRSKDFMLCDTQKLKMEWYRMVWKSDHKYRFRIDVKDDQECRALSELREKSLQIVANVLMQSVDHLRSFFLMLQKEIGFYHGCLNLYKYLRKKGKETAFPVLKSQQWTSKIENLYSVSLLLQKETEIIGNTCDLTGKSIVIMTGANQGGKTVFLRSIGQAILMTQCGMFVCASSYQTCLYRQIFTHFRKEEDTELNSGKLDEELKRMNEIVDKIKPYSCMLFNESFATTNEREGTEIGWQIMKAFEENEIRIFCVTHLFALAEGFLKEERQDVCFLHAERKSDGMRTFRMVEGKPSRTGYGKDLYRALFREEDKKCLDKSKNLML